jgi:formylmethanofuran dehydrogenase subunit E
VLHLSRDCNEELVAVVENDACGVDAIQVILGCTLGKGNLLLRDHGKPAWTIFRRRDEQSVRIILRRPIGTCDADETALRRRVLNGQGTDEDQHTWECLKEERTRKVLSDPDDELFAFMNPGFGIPEKARIFDSLACERCGESTMEPRLRIADGHRVCLACIQPYHRGW